MSARLRLSIIAGALITQPGIANAADALKEDLAPKIAASCDNGRITAAALGKAIFDSEVAPLTQEYGWAAGGAPAISKAVFASNGTSGQESLYLLQRLIATWAMPSQGGANFLPLSDGGIEIRWRDGTAVDTTQAAEDALTDILSGSDRRFAFLCRASPAGTVSPQAPATETKKSLINIAIAKSPDDLTLPLDQKSFAELAYIKDKGKDEESISIYGTIGASFGELTPIRRNPKDDRGILLRAIPNLFLQLEREGLHDGAKSGEVNNLNFGGSVSGFIQPRYDRTYNIYYSLAARYLTDTEFDSSAWSADFSLTPQLPIKGSLIPYDLIRNRLVLSWLLSGVADYHHVSDPGAKEELAGKPNFIRAGFDLRGSLRFLLDRTREHAIALKGSYELREAFGKSTGDAHWLSLALMIEPSDYYTFGLSFERGRNLDSLEFAKVWKATFGIRQ